MLLILSMKTLNKTELVAKIAATTGQTKPTVDDVLTGLFTVLPNAVSEDTKVTIPGLFSIERTRRGGTRPSKPRHRRTHPDPRVALRQAHRRRQAQSRRQVTQPHGHVSCR